MSNKRASIRRARKESQKMERTKPITNLDKWKKIRYEGQMDGKLYGIYAIWHVLYTEYGWKGKRCSKFIEAASDAALKTNSQDGANVITYVWYDRVTEAMPPAEVDLNGSDVELIERGIYGDARDEYFKYICMFCLDALNDHYGFGNTRIDRVLELLADEYKLMQHRTPDWFKERGKREVGIDMD